MPRHLAFATAAAAALSLTTGCFSYRAADAPPPPPQPLPPNAFHAPEPTPQEREALEQLRDALRVEAVAQYTMFRPLGTDRDDPLHVERRTFTTIHTSLTDHGLLWVFDPPPPRDDIDGEPLDPDLDINVRIDTLDDRLIDIIPNATFISASTLTRTRAERAAKDAVEREFNSPDAPPQLTPLNHTDTALDDAQAGIEMLLPRTAPPEPAGLVVYLPALFPNSYEYRIIQELRERGWAMLYIDVAPRVIPPNSPQREAASTRRSLELRERLVSIQNRRRAQLEAAIEAGDPAPTFDRDEERALFREVMNREDIRRALPSTGFEYQPDADIPALAARIANAVDDRIREHVNAAEAATRHTLHTIPQLRDKPIAVVGFSAGSMVAPATAVRLAETFPTHPLAFVTIGGGGDILSVALDSSLTNGGINAQSDDNPIPPDARQELVAAYRRATTLDPLRAIAAARHIPTLIAFATSDTIVPTTAAKALADAHGGADRLLYRGGHISLFYFLPRQRDRIAQWIQNATER